MTKHENIQTVKIKKTHHKVKRHVSNIETEKKETDSIQFESFVCFFPFNSSISCGQKSVLSIVILLFLLLLLDLSI